MTRAPHPAVRRLHRLGSAPARLIEQCERARARLEAMVRSVGELDLFSEWAWQPLVADIELAAVLQGVLAREARPVERTPAVPGAPARPPLPMEPRRVLEILQARHPATDTIIVRESPRRVGAVEAEGGRRVLHTAHRPVAGGFRSPDRYAAQMLTRREVSERFTVRVTRAGLVSAFYARIPSTPSVRDVEPLLQAAIASGNGAAGGAVVRTATLQGVLERVTAHRLSPLGSTYRGVQSPRARHGVHPDDRASGSGATELSDSSSGLRGLVARVEGATRHVARRLADGRSTARRESDAPAAQHAADAQVFIDRMQEEELAERIGQVLRRAARQQGVDVDGAP